MWVEGGMIISSTPTQAEKPLTAQTARGWDVSSLGSPEMVCSI